MQPKLLDVVVLTEDLPERNVRKGEGGTIVECYTEPTPAYEVEFVNPDGTTKALVALTVRQLRLAEAETQTPQRMTGLVRAALRALR